MAYDTKVLLSLLAQAIVKAETVEEAYMIIARAANVEGVLLPPFAEMLAEIKKTGKEQ